MNPTAWMEEKGICVGITLKEKEGVIDILAALQQKCGNTDYSKQLKQDVFNREEENSSVMGGGVSICQVATRAVKAPKISAVTIPNGTDFDAPDGDKVRLIFLVAYPPHVKETPVSRLAVLLMDENLREQLIGAANEQAFLNLLDLAEKGEYATVQDHQKVMPLILAVVKDQESVGVASLLQLAAGRVGKLLKIEQFPAQSFVPEDIREAAGILLVGEDVDATRFHGKPVLAASLSDARYRPEHLLNQTEQAPIFYNPPEKNSRKLWRFLKKKRGSSAKETNQ